MQYIVLDAETYYDKEYSLRNMTPVEYVLDPRFELIGMSAKINGGTALWIDGPDFGDWLGQFKPQDCCFISHNALFDMCIVAWRYHFLPRLMVDTMSMAQALTAHAHPQGRVALAAVADQLRLPAKGTTVHSVLGMSREQIIANGLYDAYSAYGKNDADLCWSIFTLLKPKFSAEQMVINDMIIRMAVQPSFQLDKDKLALHAKNLKTERDELLCRVALMGPKEDLMSDGKFANMLMDAGVMPPTKISKRTGKVAYAFAKTDKEFTDLEFHPSFLVQTLVTARLGIKSTIEESRTNRLIAISRLDFPGLTPPDAGWLPIPLKFSGAHTHRASGDWKINMQNLPNKGPMRDALKAPKGCKVVCVDSSQIEARLSAWLAGCLTLLSAFQRGEDAYAQFASTVNGFPVTKASHPELRWLGKVGVLSLMFGVGDVRFHAQVLSDSRKQNVALPENFSPEEAKRIVNVYRQGAYPEMPALWRKLNALIPGMASGGAAGQAIGPCVIERNAILLPTGMRLFYDNLRQEDRGDGRMQWIYTHGREVKGLHGSKLLENLAQALNWCIVMGAAVRLRKKLDTLGVSLAHQMHDELIYIVPDDLVTVVKQHLLLEMRRRPAWGLDLPLDAEVKVGQTYGSAKAN